MRLLTAEQSESYIYDPARVRALYEQLQPDPDLYGDDPAYAVFAYLYGSAFGADVFEGQGDGGMWPTKDEVYDPEPSRCPLALGNVVVIDDTGDGEVITHDHGDPCGVDADDRTFSYSRSAYEAVRDAITVLTNMRVTTDPMRPDEMSEIEQRRVTALGYLESSVLKVYLAEVREAALRSESDDRLSGLAASNERLVAGLREIAAGLLAEGGAQAHKVYKDKARSLLLGEAPWSQGACYICGEHVPPSEGWHREDYDGTRRHWCQAHQPVWSYDGSMRDCVTPVSLPPDAVRPRLIGEGTETPEDDGVVGR